MAIITLGKLAMPYSVPELMELYLTENQGNKAEIIISLIMIYDMSNIPFFTDILLSDTESYLKILAARGLRSLDGDGKIHLENIYSNAGDDTLLKNIIIHAKDQRI